MADSFLSDSMFPSDDSDDDDEEMYENLEEQVMAEAEIVATENTGGSGDLVDSPPPGPRPAPIPRAKVQRRLSLRVPSLPKTASPDESQTTITKEILDELLQILKTFPAPPTVSHDSQQSTTNMIYNNKITDTAVKFVSGIGKFSKFLTSSATSATSNRKQRADTTPSPMHPNYSSQNINADSF